MIVNRDSLNAMYNGFKTAYSQAFAGVQPMWNKIATLIPSTRSGNTYGYRISKETLRRWMAEAGLWQVTKGRRRTLHPPSRRTADTKVQAKDQGGS